MTINSVSDVGTNYNLYTYGNTHYNQLQPTPVSPVSQVHKTEGISREQDELKTAAVYSKNDGSSVVSNDTDVASSAALNGIFSTDENSPYSKAFSLATESLATGTNFDMTA